MSLISLFLAQILGIYFIFMGLVILLRYGDIRHIVIEILNNRTLVFVIGAFTFFIGIILILSHNIWEASWVVIITIIAWMTFFKGIVSLFLPQNVLAKFVQHFNNKVFYMIVGTLSVVIGIYLASKGFGVL